MNPKSEIAVLILSIISKYNEQYVTTGLYGQMEVEQPETQLRTVVFLQIRVVKLSNFGTYDDDDFLLGDYGHSG